jgi:hypothetical protein
MNDLADQDIYQPQNIMRNKKNSRMFRFDDKRRNLFQIKVNGSGEPVDEIFDID